jgi:hypothetical protein
MLLHKANHFFKQQPLFFSPVFSVKRCPLPNRFERAMFRQHVCVRLGPEPGKPLTALHPGQPTVPNLLRRTAAAASCLAFFFRLICYCATLAAGKKHFVTKKL